MQGKACIAVAAAGTSGRVPYGCVLDKEDGHDGCGFGRASLSGVVYCELDEAVGTSRRETGPGAGTGP